MKRKKAAALRRFGLELVGNVPWGTHLCQFYETKEDLIAILIPYFTEGLRNNEFCMWITSPPLEAEEAKQVLKKSVPELDQYIQRGQIEIFPYTEWYLLGGSFNSDRVLRDWVKKEKAALDSGFDGLRLTGNTFWLERTGWKAFTDYEEQINNTIGKHKMIAVCTYSLDKCNANEVIDVVKNHQFALIKRSGKWELIESSETKKIQRALLRSEKKFSVLYSSMIEGVAFHDVVYDSSGKAVDYVITDVNPSFEKITGLSKKQVIGKRASELYGIGEPPYLDVYANVASSGKPASFETYFPPLQKHFSISVLSPSKGKFTTVFHDVTRHRQTEEALRSAALFPEQNPSSVLRVARDGTLLYANKSSAQLLDLWKCQNTQRVPEQIRQQVTQALDAQQIIQREVSYGSVTYSFVIAPIAQYDYANIYGNDITKRKMAEKALRERENDLNRAQAVAKTGSWRLDVRRNELLWSDETYRMFGIPKGTPLTYETFLGAIHPDDKEYVDQKWKAALRGEPYEIEHRIITKGEAKWVREKAELEFGKDGVLLGGFGTVQDITERKKTEQELFNSLRESQLRQAEVAALLKASKTVLKNREFEVSARTIFESCKELIGAKAGYVALLSDDGKDNIVLFLESGGLPCNVDPSVPMPIRGLRAETYNTGKVAVENDFSKSEWTKLLPSGHVNLENVLFAPLTVNSRTVGIIGLANKPGGFTERDAQMALAFGEIASIALFNSKMLEMLEENAQKLKAQSEDLEKLVEERTKKLELSALYARSLIEASLDPLVTINVVGKITDVNRATELATGCSREQLIGSDFSDYFTEPEKARTGYKKVFAEGFVRDYPLAIRHKSGKTTGVLYNASIYRNAQGEIQGIFAAARDITELKKAEEKAQESAKKLKDAERLAAIGATAGMVGHDIRNPLQSILGDVYLAKMDLASLPDSEEKEGLQESLEALEKQTEYINKIVLDLQDFAKPLNPHAEETDIEIIINELLMRNGVPKNIQTDAKVDVDAKTMMADSAYMKRIIGNLVSNAVQAMPNGGKLTIRAYREAGAVVITVEDTGVGISEDAKPKLFQPLFTTKSKGQGFGLSVVKRLTEALNGTITFESQEGKGTKFALRFPSAPKNGCP